MDLHTSIQTIARIKLMETRIIGRRKPRGIGEPRPSTAQEQAWFSSFAHR